MNFEDKLKEIQQILKKLEDGAVPFDKSIALFEEGIKLTKECQDYLNTYKSKFEVIKEELDK